MYVAAFLAKVFMLGEDLGEYFSTIVIHQAKVNEDNEVL